MYWPFSQCVQTRQRLWHSIIGAREQHRNRFSHGKGGAEHNLSSQGLQLQHKTSCSGYAKDWFTWHFSNSFYHFLGGIIQVFPLSSRLLRAHTRKTKNPSCFCSPAVNNSFKACGANPVSTLPFTTPTGFYLCTTHKSGQWNKSSLPFCLVYIWNWSQSLFLCPLSPTAGCEMNMSATLNVPLKDSEISFLRSWSNSSRRSGSHSRLALLGLGCHGSITIYLSWFVKKTHLYGCGDCGEMFRAMPHISSCLASWGNPIIQFSTCDVMLILNKGAYQRVRNVHGSVSRCIQCRCDCVAVSSLLCRSDITSHIIY